MSVASLYGFCERRSSSLWWAQNRLSTDLQLRGVNRGLTKCARRRLLPRFCCKAQTLFRRLRAQPAWPSTTCDGSILKNAGHHPQKAILSYRVIVGWSRNGRRNGPPPLLKSYEETAPLWLHSQATFEMCDNCRQWSSPQLRRFVSRGDVGCLHDRRRDSPHLAGARSRFPDDARSR